MRLLTPLLLLLLIQACKHPLAIQGEGDIADVSGNGFGCSLEQYQSRDAACDNNVTGDYFVNYEARPRPGWRFVDWEGGSCGHLTVAPLCRFDVPAFWVQYWDENFAAIPIPPIVARFEKVLEISAVSGNTASLNAVAEFSVVLTREPAADVVIPVLSDDTEEGIVEQESLNFDSENWNIPQLVTVRGTNESVVNGFQDYNILLGAATSSDAFYAGITAEVPMDGIVLDIAAPFPLNDIFAGAESNLDPRVTYTGSSQLSFSLEEPPEGMTVDLNSGIIAWTPPESAKGQSFSIVLKVNDGALFAETAFNLRVVDLEPIDTSVTDDTLTIVDGDTDLNGLTITAGDIGTGDINSLALELIPADSVPPLPDWIVPLSDAFYITNTFEESVELRLPLSDLPDGFNLGQVNLFGYTQPHDIDELIWSSVLLDTTYEGTLENPVVVISLQELQGMYLFGLKNIEGGAESVALGQRTRDLERSAAGFAAEGDITCVPRQLPLGGGPNYNEQDCVSSAAPSLAIFVKDFGSNEGATRWGGTTIGELVDWLVEAQVGFDDLGLDYDNAFSVVIEPMPYLGYVTTGNGENRRTLHITSDNSWPQHVIKGTAVHEYFHHAQGKKPIVGQGLLINGDASSNWIIEGTSRWFEDELFDHIDTYVAKEGGTGTRILRPGLSAVGSSGFLRPYQRFSFFKLMTSHCPGFYSVFNELLNAELGTDPGGVHSFVSEFGNAGCDFGSHLGGSESDSLAAAMVLYQYATMSENMISLLDDDENDSNFNFHGPNLQFSLPFYATMAEWLAAPQTPVHTLNNVGSIPPAGAFSFVIPAISGVLPEDRAAELSVNSDQELIVSLTSVAPEFVGQNTLDGKAHDFFSTNTGSSYVYNAEGTVPEVFVTIVNPSMTTAVAADITFKIREELGDIPIILEPEQGALVNQRVTRVVGVIPEADRASVNRVVVTSNGIASETTMNTDGSFFADVVIGIGENTIRSQGFSSANPVTEEKTINVTGVENDAGGQNSLVPSRLVFILRWDTDGTDLDIYSTDKSGGPGNEEGVIYWSNQTVGPGSLDFDNVSGFGPEVISYRDIVDDVYVNGTFNVDVHFYSGSTPTNYTIDIIVNETDGANRRFLKFESVMPHTVSNNVGAGVNVTDVSRFDDVVVIGCSSQSICSLSSFDDTRLAEAGSSSSDAGVQSASLVSPPPLQAITARERCQADWDVTVAKYGYVNWTCDDAGRRN